MDLQPNSGRNINKKGSRIRGQGWSELRRGIGEDSIQLAIGKCLDNKNRTIAGVS